MFTRLMTHPIPLFDRVSFPRFYAVFPSVGKNRGDEPPLRILARVMSERLNQTLVKEKQRAAANKHFEPSQSVIGVVGDLKRIEQGIRELNPGEIRQGDADGRLAKGAEKK